LETEISKGVDREGSEQTSVTKLWKKTYGSQQFSKENVARLNL